MKLEPELRMENMRLHALVEKYERAMKHVVDELEEDFDVVDSSDGQSQGNKAMKLAHELEEAMHGPGGF